MAVIQPTPATLAQNTSALDGVIAKVKAQVGVFLGNESMIYDAKTRIKDLIGSGANAALVNNAKALSAKADALLTIQKDAEGQAQSFIGQAGAIQTQMSTNPLYSFLNSSPTYWGIRQYELIGNLLSQTTSLLPAGAALTSRLLKQNSDVKTFMGEVESTERAAAGTGALPKITGVVSGILGSVTAPLTGLVWPVAIVAGFAALVWLSPPGFLRGKK